MNTTAIRVLAALFSVIACGARADAIMIEYLVEFDQSGQDVYLGSTVDWTLSARVTDSTPGNFGIFIAGASLVNSTGEDMSTNQLAAPFSGYVTLPPDASTPGELNEIGASLIPYNVSVVELADGGDLGPIALYTGSYTVTQLGMHTLTTVMPLSQSFYFTEATGNVGLTTEYDITTFGDSDFVNVIVPEPASMLLASTLLFPGLIAVRRRRRQTAELAA